MNNQHRPRVLAIYRHYWPDTTPYALILKAILERLAETGADVSVYTGQPSYNDNQLGGRPAHEILSGVTVLRVAMPPERKHWRIVRGFNAVYFLLRSIAHAVCVRRYDVLLANSHPPIAIGLALRLICWLTAAKYVLHLQDLHPEAERVVRQGRGGLLYKLALAIETTNCKRAARLVTLSEDMRDSLSRREGRLSMAMIINNCPLADTSTKEIRLPDCVTDAGATRFLFAGNLGRFQNLEAILHAAHLLADRDDWRMIFMGSGALRSRLQELAGALLNKRVFFTGQQPVATAVAAMRACDYGLVSLAAGVSQYAYPSKSITYLANGCPVIAVVEPGSELGRIIHERELGYVAGGFGGEEIAATLRRALETPTSSSPNARLRIKAAADDRFGREAMLTKWDAVWDGLGMIARPLTRNSQARSGRTVA